MIDHMARELRHLLLTTTENPYDMTSWSGIPYSLRTALERCVERVTVLAMTKPRRTPLAVAQRMLSGSQRYPLWISRPALEENARQVRSAIVEGRPDAVLSISSPPVVLLTQPSVPMFLFSDAPYMTFVKAYARWESFPKRLGRFSMEEKALVPRLSGLCYGSAWACEEARREYGMLAADAERKLHTTPLGTNFQPSDSQEEVEARIKARDARELHLLFVGRDWERKGGPLAVEVARLLRATGLPVRLHIVGCNPEVREEFAVIHGLLSRDNPEQKARLEKLYLDCHFLITPTLADCFGIVFAEAQAFGLPPVSRSVDAVSSVVLDGETGCCSPRTPRRRRT